MAVAKNTDKRVVLHYYGYSGLDDRIIETNFSNIVDLKVGKNEKLIYISDKSQGVLAEYLLQEIGCPPSDDV